MGVGPAIIAWLGIRLCQSPVLSGGFGWLFCLARPRYAGESAAGVVSLWLRLRALPLSELDRTYSQFDRIRCGHDAVIAACMTWAFVNK